MKILLNHSHLPSNQWDEVQKGGFDRIIDFALPNVPLDYSLADVIDNFVTPAVYEISRYANMMEENNSELNIVLLSDNTNPKVSMYLKYVRDVINQDKWNYYIPVFDDEGKFVKWEIT